MMRRGEGELGQRFGIFPQRVEIRRHNWNSWSLLFESQSFGINEVLPNISDGVPRLQSAVESRHKYIRCAEDGSRPRSTII